MTKVTHKHALAAEDWPKAQPKSIVPVPRVRVASVAEMRELDRRTIEEFGLPALVLMERAALGVVEALRLAHPEVAAARARAIVLAGTGNNGGDGLAIARLLHGLGKPVEVILFGDQKSRTAENQAQLAMAQALELPIHRSTDVDVRRRLKGCDLLVDALFGVGLTRSLDDQYVELFNHLNEHREALVLAVDIPSGLDGDRGSTRGAVLRADMTVTLGWPKLGLLMDQAADQVGALWLVDIGLPQEFSRALPGALLDGALAHQLLPARRPRNSHKGMNGMLLGIVGSRDMSGAARLVAGAALATGVGILRLAVPKSIHDLVAAAHPEALVVPLPENQDGVIAGQALEILKGLFPRSSAMVIGPGLGRSDELSDFITALLSAFDKPILLDADGLTNMRDPGQTLSWRASADTVITPHAGEMGKLMGTTANLVQQDRSAAALRMARESGTTVVLKGAHSIVAQPDGSYWLNTTGNPGMATGGSGDVLAGVIGGLLAQGQGTLRAALLGTYLHGLAGDLAAAAEPGWQVLPSDQVKTLPRAVASLSQGPPPPIHSPCLLL